MDIINSCRRTIVVLLVLLMISVIMSTASVGAQSPDGEITVSPSEISLDEGESETVAITYKKLSSATPQGIQYSMKYNTDVIAVTDQQQGSYLGGSTLINDISTPGQIEYIEAVTDGNGVETNNGTVATITVKAARDSKDNTSNLAFTTAKASKGSIRFSITTSNGTVETSGTQTDDSVDSNSQDTAKNTDKQSKESDSNATEESDGSDNGTDNAVETAQNETTEDTDEQSQASDGDTIEEANSSASAEDSTVETTANETDDSTTESDSESEADTNESIPGFGVIITVLSVLTFVYIIRSKGSL